MSTRSKGSASILFMVVVLPFLAILALVGIEMTQFFGMREEARRILDSEAKQSVGRPYSPDSVARRVAMSFQALQPYVEVLDVRADATAQRAEIVVTGTFNGALNTFVGHLLQREAVGIPFRISSGVRRARTIGLVVLDRTIGAGEAPCGSTNLTVRATMVSELARRLEAAGVEHVMVGIVPGIDAEVDLLLSNDRLPRCGGARRGHRGVESIEGIAEAPFMDSVAVAYRATQLLLLADSAAPVEQRAIVMVAPPQETRSRTLSTTFSLLEHEAARQNSKVTALGLVVGGSKDGNFFETQSGVESGRAKYLHISEDEAQGADAQVALVHHIQGHTFIAR